jgi:hypothetical protein
MVAAVAGVGGTDVRPKGVGRREECEATGRKANIDRAGRVGVEGPALHLYAVEHDGGAVDHADGISDTAGRDGIWLGHGPNPNRRRARDHDGRRTDQQRHRRYTNAASQHHSLPLH